MRRTLLIIVASSVSCGHPAAQRAPSAVSSAATPQVAVIQGFGRGLASVRARNPDVKLRVERHPSLPSEHVLIVDYPSPSNDPAGRDVWCDAEEKNWSQGRGIAFQVKSAHATRLSVSFLDRNRVAYTTWIDVPDTTWQPVRLDFEKIRPNPYFQPPDAITGKPLDVSEMTGLAFAPQDRAAGRLMISAILLERR